MTNLLRISQELVSTQPTPAVESRGAVAAFALTALTGAERPHPLLDQYHIVSITPGSRWEEINLFLLGETHNREQCHNINGAFIRAFGSDEATVFMESVPSMQELPVDEQQKSREQLGLSCRARFIGWDASEEIQDILFAGEGSTEQNLAAIPQKMQEVVQRRDQLRAQESQLASLQDDDSGELKSALEKAYAACAIAYKEQEKLLSALHKEEQVLKRLIERKITHISDPIRSTFPARTRSMVETLQQVKKIDSKIFLIAGHAHLQSIPLLSGPEFDLGSMHEELSHHKAAILVPKICECRTYEQIVVDSLVLPEGLVLTEEQKAELKKRLISQTTTMEETLSAFLEPLMLPYLGKMEVAQSIVDELELPEGLVLTEEQKEDLKERLLSCMLRSEDFSDTMNAFLVPIIQSFFLRNAEK